MTQTLYAHMNKKKENEEIIKENVKKKKPKQKVTAIFS
jgi:hypothetical protein